MDTNMVGTKKEDSKKYQHYNCARIAMNMVTEEGKKIRFVNHQYITADELEIAYLNDQIDRGLKVITKDKLMTLEEADPMAALKRKHIAEYLAKESAELVAESKGESRDMGNTESKPAISPASSKAVVGGQGNKVTSAKPQ